MEERISECINAPHPDTAPTIGHTNNSRPAELEYPWRMRLAQGSVDVGNQRHSQVIRSMPLKAVALVRLANPGLARPARCTHKKINAIGVRSPVDHAQPLKLGRSGGQTRLLAQFTHGRGADRFSSLNVPAGQAVETVEKSRPRTAHQQHLARTLTHDMNTRRDPVLLHQCLPVLPNPSVPRSLAAKSSTILSPTCSTGTTTSCAMRSIGWMVKLARPRFHTDTKICP